MNKQELSDAARAIAKQGGKATLKKHGKEHYKAMAKKRWAKNKPNKIKSMADENSVSLKEYFEKILEGDRRANDQRFGAQEKAIETAERSRDIAIKKAEDSIEKKSDAVYVKLTDLQTALAEVMRRPEIESRFTGFTEKIDELKTYKDVSTGRQLVITTAISAFISIIVGLSVFFFTRAVNPPATPPVLTQPVSPASTVVQPVTPQ